MLNTETRMKPVHIIVEHHHDGYIAYPVGIRGIIVGEGDTYDDAVNDCTSAVRFHIETFGDDLFTSGDLTTASIAQVMV
jgi:hypothetical protein